MCVVRLNGFNSPTGDKDILIDLQPEIVLLLNFALLLLLSPEGVEVSLEHLLGVLGFHNRRLVTRVRVSCRLGVRGLLNIFRHVHRNWRAFLFFLVHQRNSIVVNHGGALVYF